MIPQDGWIDARARLPKVGDLIELQMGTSPDTKYGTLCGTTKVVHPVPRAEDWTLVSPFNGDRVWVRYWRKVQ